MLKRHEIRVLRRAGHSQVDTAKLAGVSERSIRRLEGEAAVTVTDTSAERRHRRIGRPTKAETFRVFLAGELAKQPQVMFLDLLRRARLQEYRGGKGALYGLMAAIRLAKAKPVPRLEGLPREFTQHDFGHVDVHFIDGARKRVHFFASRVKILTLGAGVTGA